jgi:GNAT superfamily N-acetyltransferase
MVKSKAVKESISLNKLTYKPLSRNNWNKFVDLFGERGACGNCWCMSFRLKNSEYQKGKVNNINKNRMKKLVWNNAPTGLLAFYNDKAIGWCALAPRKDFVRLEYSRVHKRIDDKPVWSIPCFFIDKRYRLHGISVEMLRAVIIYAKKKKIKILEAYPAIPTQEKLPDAFLWVGLFTSFQKAGFKVVDRTSQNRPMVRYYVS